MHFTKMHGLGNDYLYVYGEVPADIVPLARRLSDRHFGAGSDGMIYISGSDVADFRMRIFNADGSEAQMCGNGIRCVGKYVYDKGYTDRTCLTVETLSGIRKLKMEVRSGRVKSVSVDMGTASVGEETEILTAMGPVKGIPVDVGNPHFVVFTDDPDAVPVAELGPLIEKHEAFPDGVNVEFVKAEGEDRLRMRVWERGSGITLACGTGACASTAAAAATGRCRAYEPVCVRLDGGDLKVLIEEGGKVTMTGPAETVYEGEAEP